MQISFSRDHTSRLRDTNYTSFRISVHLNKLLTEKRTMSRFTLAPRISLLNSFASVLLISTCDFRLLFNLLDWSRRNSGSFSPLTLARYVLHRFKNFRYVTCAILVYSKIKILLRIHANIFPRATLISILVQQNTVTITRSPGLLPIVSARLFSDTAN